MPVKKDTEEKASSNAKATDDRDDKKQTGEETFNVRGDELLKKVKELIKEGNVRKITIKNKEGKTIIVLPLTVGVIGAVVAPVLAAVGAIAALVTECSVSVEREK